MASKRCNICDKAYPDTYMCIFKCDNCGVSGFNCCIKTYSDGVLCRDCADLLDCADQEDYYCEDDPYEYDSDDYYDEDDDEEEDY